jgi:hypothetical protein
LKTSKQGLLRAGVGNALLSVSQPRPTFENKEEAMTIDEIDEILKRYHESLESIAAETRRRWIKQLNEMLEASVVEVDEVGNITDGKDTHS